MVSEIAVSIHELSETGHGCSLLCRWVNEWKKIDISFSRYDCIVTGTSLGSLVSVEAMEMHCSRLLELYTHVKRMGVV